MSITKKSRRDSTARQKDIRNYIDSVAMKFIKNPVEQQIANAFATGWNTGYNYLRKKQIGHKANSAEVLDLQLEVENGNSNGAG